jgi:hypothetical protein
MAPNQGHDRDTFLAPHLQAMQTYARNLQEVAIRRLPPSLHAICWACNNFSQPALKASCFKVPQLLPCDQPNAQTVDGSFPCSAIPSGDTFETNFLPGGGQRNIFRQSWQKRADISIVKMTQITERAKLRYSFDVFNLTNLPSFDIPIDNIDQNLAFSPFSVAQPPYGDSTTPPLASGCNSSTPSNGFYVCPTGLGQEVKTIGSARQIQMSLSLQF